jgi:hypothetical protein
MTTPATRTPRQRFLAQLWTGLNSALLITLISAVTAALLTHWFADREAENTDMAARRAELSRDLVEIQLRMARLIVIEGQGADRKAFMSAAMTRIGKRAVAIVSADAATVTSDPSFKNVHLVTVLGRAETAAGLNLSDKSYLLNFTDRDPAAAVALTPNVVCRLNELVFYLTKRFQSGEFPLRIADKTSRANDSATYTLLNSPKLCAAPAVASPAKAG